MKVMQKTMKNQKGLTLLELITALLIVGLIVSGAVALFSTADSAQKSNRMTSDLMAIRSAVKGLYAGNGGYGTTNLNGTLKSSKRIPTTMTVDASTPPVITHSMNGTLTVQGATSQYTITVTNIPTDVCVQLLTNSNSGWVSVKVGGAGAITTFPIDPGMAANATYCGASDANNMVFTGA